MDQILVSEDAVYICPVLGIQDCNLARLLDEVRRSNVEAPIYRRLRRGGLRLLAFYSSKRSEVIWNAL